MKGLIPNYRKVFRSGNPGISIKKVIRLSQSACTSPCCRINRWTFICRKLAKYREMKTRLKKIAFLLALLTAAFGLQAQFRIKGGFGGGVITGPVRIEHIDDRFTDVINGKNLNGFEAGFLLKAQAGPIYIKPMAMYGFRYGNVTYTGPDGADYAQNFTMHRIEFPVLLGINFLGPFFVEGGPSYNYIFSATERYDTYNVRVTPSTLGYRVGVGAELGPILLSVNYGGATYRFSGDRATFKEPYKLIFGLGIILGGDLDDRYSNRKFNNND